MRLLAAASLVVLSTTGCIPSNVLAVDERSVDSPVQAFDWRPAAPEDVPGYYASEAISGPMAGVLLRVYYLFEQPGTYTGAALIGGGRPRFEVLSGTWALEEGWLQLDDAAPARLESAEMRLRLIGEEGQVVLRREDRP